MEKQSDNMQKVTKPESPAPHPPTDSNPYPYPIQQPNRKGWIRALIALIIVAAVVTIVCLVVGIYDHHQESLQSDAVPETIVVEP